MNHPIEEGLAPLYALGALTQHETRAFEEHLAEDCETCREELGDYAAVVGLLGFGAEAVAPSDEVRAKVLASLGTSAESSIPEFAIAQSVTIRAGEGRWFETSKGIFVKSLFVDDKRGTVSSLVKMTPGSRLPRHRHYGVEECLVLEGDVQAGDQMLVAGDYHCAMKDSIHEQLSTINGALLMIVGPRSYEVLEAG